MPRKYQLIDVFTPTTPAKVTFVERDKDAVNNRLVRALQMPGNQVVIYGHSGSGKSTLLENVLPRIYEDQINTNCMKGMTFEQIVLDAFDQLSPFYVNEITTKRQRAVNAKLQAEYLNIKAHIGATYQDEEGNKIKRLIPPQLTPQSLGRLLGHSGYCWVLEDFHKLDSKEKVKLVQMMKVCANLSNQFKDLKIVSLGAVNTARQVVQLDREMRRRVAEIHVDLMEQDEIRAIIEKGCRALNIIINQELQDEIIRHSNGLASICHKICYLMCSSAMISKTVEEPIEFNSIDLQTALAEYIKDEEDTLKNDFDSALKIPKVEATLRILVQHELDGAHIDDLYTTGRDASLKVSKEKICRDLASLQQEEFGEMVKFEENSQKYSFIDPFYRSFAMAYFRQKDTRPKKKGALDDREFLELLNRTMKAMKARYH